MVNELKSEALLEHCRIAATNPMRYRLIPHHNAETLGRGPCVTAGSTLNWKGSRTLFFSRKIYLTKWLFLLKYVLTINNGAAENMGLEFSLQMKKLY